MPHINSVSVRLEVGLKPQEVMPVLITGIHQPLAPALVDAWWAVDRAIVRPLAQR